MFFAVVGASVEQFHNQNSLKSLTDFSHHMHTRECSFRISRVRLYYILLNHYFIINYVSVVSRCYMFLVSLYRVHQLESVSRGKHRRSIWRCHIFVPCTIPFPRRFVNFLGTVFRKMRPWNAIGLCYDRWTRNKYGKAWLIEKQIRNRVYGYSL